MTCSDKISDFQLKTSYGQIISDRVCCHDDIIASWIIINPAAECSDDNNLGFIQCSDPCGTVITHPLTKNTSDYRFSFNECCQGNGSITFFRQCSDGCSDSFTRALEFFKTTVNASDDRSILLGETVTLGDGSPDAHTLYHWTSNDSCDVISDAYALHTVVRPCKPGCHVYTITAHDSDFPQCSDSDSVTIDVASASVTWSDVHQSDAGATCTFIAHLLSSDTYTNEFHITLKNTITGLDISDYYAVTPHCFIATVPKPSLPGTDAYILKAALSDFEDCSYAVATAPFLCSRPSLTLPGGPSTFEMLIRLFGFLFVFILLGLMLSGNQ